MATMFDVTNYMDTYVSFNSGGIEETIKINVVKSRENTDRINILIDNLEQEEKKEFETMKSVELEKSKEIITNPILNLEL